MLTQEEFKEKLLTLKDMRSKKSALAEETKEVNKTIDRVVYDLVEHMETEEQQSVRFEGIGNCILEHKKRYLMDDAEKFETWMDANDDMNMVYAIHASKVHAYYKDRLETGESLPDGIQTFIKNNIIIRS